jgi:hypothetical protein
VGWTTSRRSTPAQFIARWSKLWHKPRNAAEGSISQEALRQHAAQLKVVRDKDSRSAARAVARIPRDLISRLQTCCGKTKRDVDSGSIAASLQTIRAGAAPYDRGHFPDRERGRFFISPGGSMRTRTGSVFRFLLCF